LPEEGKEDEMISLEGRYDLHMHPAPSIQKRKFTALESVRLGSKEKMGGLLFLDHTYNTTMIASTINELGLHTKAFGVIMLNEAVGGLNPSVVEIALALGTTQIQMPTYSSRNHQAMYGDDQKIFPYKKRVKPYFILDDQGRLLPEIEEILELIKGTNAHVGCGHLSVPEVDALVKRAREQGCRVLANAVSTDMPNYPVDAQKRWADQGVFIEHAYMAITEVPHVTVPVESIVAQIRTVGAERCVLGTDSGNMRLPDNVTALRNFVEKLMEAGITEHEIDRMTRVNPPIVLGIS
jgi:Family of unknown function (DUF6282)